MTVDLRKMMTLREAAHYPGASEGMVRGIGRSYLQRKFGKPRRRDPEVIAGKKVFGRSASLFVGLTLLPS